MNIEKKVFYSIFVAFILTCILSTISYGKPSYLTYSTEETPQWSTYETWEKVYTAEYYGVPFGFNIKWGYWDLETQTVAYSWQINIIAFLFNLLFWTTIILISVILINKITEWRKTRQWQNAGENEK